MSECTHRNIGAWYAENCPVDFWACEKCHLKFVPITKEIELERELAAAVARVAELERDVGRWKFAWENDLVLHQWNGEWWCTRTDFRRDEHEYQKAPTKEAAIDSAMVAK